MAILIPQLKNAPLDKLLFFDIETAADQEDIHENDEVYSVIEYKFKDKETGLPVDFESNRKKYLKEAALHPALNRIVCISVGFIHKGTLRVKDIIGKEEDIIKEFMSIIPGFILVGLNSSRFDWPVIRFRAFHYGISVSQAHNDILKKPWDLSFFEKGFPHIDLGNLLKGSYYNMLSMVETCHLLGISTPKDDLQGSEVSAAFWNGEIERIATYCGKDVLATANIFMRLLGEELLEFSSDYVPPKKVTLLDKIYADKDLSEEVKEQLKNLIAKSKITKKDKGNLSEMLCALLTPSKCKVTVKKQVEKDVNEFIKTL